MSTSAWQWIDDPKTLDDVVDELVDQPIYGIDTEFHREGSYYARLSLVQLAWPDRVGLIDPLALDLTPLARLFAGDGLAVAHAAEQDLEVLERACGVIPTRLFDTQVASGFLGFSSPSLASLVEELIGVRLPKNDRVADWTLRPLSTRQLDYAAADVAHLLDLHRVLTGRLQEWGRLGWAEDECEALRVRRRGVQDPEVAWWRIKDARSLRGRSRGVAQAVSAWRERTAATTDRPPRTVLSDLALLGLAQRPPTDDESLRRIRGLEVRHLKRGADKEILAAVAEGLAMSPKRLRLPPPADDVERSLRPAVALISAWIAQLARNEHLDTALLATRSDVCALLRGDTRARLTIGWRAELVGEPIRRLVAGEAALAFNGDGSLVLEPRCEF